MDHPATKLLIAIHYNFLVHHPIRQKDPIKQSNPVFFFEKSSKLNQQTGQKP